MDTSPPDPSSRQPPSRWARLGALVLVIAITVGITLFRDHLDDFAALGYLGAFFAMLVGNATLVLPAPGLLVIFALGATLNPALVGLIGGGGATLGEITGYLAGYSGTGLMQDSPMRARVERWMDHNGALTIFILSIVPNPFFDIAGLVAGAARMSLLRFLGITYCGKSIQGTLIRARRDALD